MGVYFETLAELGVAVRAPCSQPFCYPVSVSLATLGHQELILYLPVPVHRRGDYYRHFLKEKTPARSPF